MKMNDHQKEYFLQENSQLREEILENIKGINEAERYALIMSGAIWAWLVTQQWTLSFIIAVCIPALATGLLYRKREALSDAIKEKATYIKKIEGVFELKSTEGEALGWERREREKNFKNWSKTYWKLLLWGNIVIALIYLLTQYIKI